MKIISTKEYNKLMKMKSDYLDLLWKPFQGVFEKVTDDDLLRENGLLYAENQRLNNIINKVLFILEHIEDDRVGYETCIDLLKGVDKDEN